MYLLRTSTYPMTICRYNARVKLKKKKTIVACRLKKTRARTRPVGTLSAISINFTKG